MGPIAPPPVTDSSFARLVAHARRPLYSNALVLIVNSGLAAALGFLFWALAARLYPAAQVGLASAAISLRRVRREPHPVWAALHARAICAT